MSQTHHKNLQTLLKEAHYCFHARPIITVSTFKKYIYTVNYKSLHFRGPFLLAFKILLILNMSSTRVLVTFVTLLLMSSSANAQTSNENDEGSDPWKTPLQELEVITPRCIMKIPEFGQLAFKAQVFFKVV